MTRLLFRAGVTAAALVLGALTHQSSAGATTAATVVVQTRPVDSGGNLATGYRITQRIGGAHCLGGSIATGSAYRCFSGNGIFDPCWVTARRAYVVCLAGPWNHQVWRLHVTKGYDNSGFRYVRPATYPWAVQLTDGTRCGFLQGATGAVNGRRLNYGCLGSTDDLVGDPDRSHGLWRIRIAHDTGDYHYIDAGWVSIARAYFGRPSRRG